MPQSAPTYAPVDLAVASPNISPHRRQGPPRTPSPLREAKLRPTSHTSPAGLGLPGHDADRGRFGLTRIGKALTSRIVRSARRGNLPFIVVFISCLYVFFSALAGIGYVDPDNLPSTQVGHPGPAEFVPGAPVFDPNQDSEIARRHRAEVRRALELEWQKKKRPQDGTWLKSLRDDRAVRRVKPVQIPQVIRDDPLPIPDATEQKPHKVDLVEKAVDEQQGQTKATEHVSGGTRPDDDGPIDKRDAQDSPQDNVVEQGDEVL